MFGDKAALLAELVATGKVPVPSTLVIGMGMGMGLTAIRLLLDFAVFKVRSCHKRAIVSFQDDIISPGSIFCLLLQEVFL